LDGKILALGYYSSSNLDQSDRFQSKAQAELNYAVHYSFSQAGVSCTSTLEASESWCAFDDQYFQEKGYRLNADPYWIAPPQGSIIPLWHRSAAPNYQPKPLIAKHRSDPVKVWRKRHGCPARLLEKKNLTPLVVSFYNLIFSKLY
jgi:nitric oxide synthase oxygenase domain/subunit